MEEHDTENVGSNPSLEQSVEETRQLQLRNEYESLKDEHMALQNQMIKVRNRNDRLQEQNENLQKEVSALKNSPLNVGEVKSVILPDERPEEFSEEMDEYVNGDEDATFAVVSQENKNVFLTQVPPSVDGEISAGDTVALGNQMGIRFVIDSTVDAQAQAMAIDDSPDVEYSDIGGIDEQIETVRETIEYPLESPELFEQMNVDLPTGIMLHGPPGTGKTMLARAVANETDATFIRLSASELVKKYIGEGARLVRDVFEMARENTPAIIFIDEIDAVANKRQADSTGSNEVQRTLMQLFTELDGFEKDEDIFVIGATNRLDMLDSALLRPGRFDLKLNIGYPDSDGLRDILTVYLDDVEVGDVDIDRTVNKLSQFNDGEGAGGADVQSVVNQAAMSAIRNGRDSIDQVDIGNAIERIENETVEETNTQAFY